DNKLTSFGLPVIIVRAVMGAGDWQKGILNFYKDQKILTASLSDVDISKQISDSRFTKLISKINLIVALNKIKQTKLLLLQEPEVLGNYDIYGMDFHVPLPKNYNEIYSRNLKELNLDIKHISLTELLENINEIEETNAEKITNIWKSEAKEVKSETNKSEILKVAKMYLAMENLLKKYDAEGIIIRSLVPWIKEMIDVTPCLANTELNKQLKVGVCEGLVNSAVTELFGIHFAGKPSFIGDVVGIDTINDTIIFAHCQSPINPHGNDRVPYVIRSHALQKENKMFPKNYPEIGKSVSAAVKVDLPTNEVITITKMSIYYKKIAISTGMTVPGWKLYKDFDDRLCRTKLVVKTNAKAFEEYYDTVTFGVHRNILFGDYREKIKEIATIIGYEVVDEGKH
ncbi:MAG: hypothetical protein DRP89_08485, partial [Candidatus Neomarinimicrobiota bacterium]